MQYLRKKQILFITLDFNPRVFKELNSLNIPVILGDVTDEEILELAGVEKAKLLISTSPDINDNLIILEVLSGLHTKPTTIFTSASREDGIKLYENGANYVLVPHTVTGEHIRHILSTYGVGSERIRKLGKASYKRLRYSS